MTRSGSEKSHYGSCRSLNTLQSHQHTDYAHTTKHQNGATTKIKTPLMKTIAGVAGNVLEWYDFAVFGYFSDVIASIFFPPQEGDAQLIESFAVFGGAFIMRPIGGAVMGYIGDKFGAQRALEISVFLMAFPTFAMVRTYLLQNIDSPYREYLFHHYM